VNLTTIEESLYQEIQNSKQKKMYAGKRTSDFFKGIVGVAVTKLAFKPHPFP
jgi:hypothetical protein